MSFFNAYSPIILKKSIASSSLEFSVIILFLGHPNTILLHLIDLAKSIAFFV